METKTCKHCGETKEISEFLKSKTYRLKDGTRKYQYKHSVLYVIEKSIE